MDLKTNIARQGEEKVVRIKEAYHMKNMVLGVGRIVGHDDIWLHTVNMVLVLTTQGDSLKEFT